MMDGKGREGILVLWSNNDCGQDATIDLLRGSVVSSTGVLGRAPAATSGISEDDPANW